MRDISKAAGLFKPVHSKSESKASATNSAARAILNEEARLRERKTAKLRAARLEMEARSADDTGDRPESPAKGKKKVAAKR